MDFLNFPVRDGVHFVHCACLIEKKKHCSTCSRWHQAEFSSVGYTLPEQELPEANHRARRSAQGKT